MVPSIYTIHVNARLIFVDHNLINHTENQEKQIIFGNNLNQAVTQSARELKGTVSYQFLFVLM